MIVSIWRHGVAEAGAIDRQRALTIAGRDDVGFGCRQFHHACESRGLVHATAILYSPWLRTTQTAEIIAGAFTHAEITAEEALAPGSDVAAVAAVLSQRATAGGEEQHVVLVSHQPLVSQLADYFLGDAGRVPALTPGGLVTLALDTPAAACACLLFWALPPEFEAGL